jgi:pimeloyl-ACP methyl ester carboxylesterase
MAWMEIHFSQIRIHLIGHSFGGRLVSSVANAFPGGDWGHQVSSTYLLQAAFSQFGFSKNYLGTGLDGAFRNVLARNAVCGEIAVTHTTNDIANGLAYPLASRLFNQVASAVGDANDLYGATGANGAQDVPEPVQDTLAAEGGNYLALPLVEKSVICWTTNISRTTAT